MNVQTERVIRFGESNIVKCGLHFSLTEGQTLLFLKETQRISVPEFFTLYSRDDVNAEEANFFHYGVCQGPKSRGMQLL